MARWLLALSLGITLCIVALPGCTKETGPKLDVKGGNPGFQPGQGSAPVHKKPVGQ
jgi:hypothetical protein